MGNFSLNEEMIKVSTSRSVSVTKSAWPALVSIFFSLNHASLIICNETGAFTFFISAQKNLLGAIPRGKRDKPLSCKSSGKEIFFVCDCLNLSLSQGSARTPLFEGKQESHAWKARGSELGQSGTGQIDSAGLLIKAN